MYGWILSQGFSPVIIATKCDKLGKNDKPKAVRLIRETLDLGPDAELIMFSAVDKTGLSDIYRRISPESGEVPVQ